MARSTAGAIPSGSTASKATGDTAADLDAQIRQIRAEVSKLAETIANASTVLASDVKMNAGSKASQVRQMSEDSIQELRGQVSRLEDSLSQQVRDRPLTALGAAACIGFIVALCARR